MDITCPVTFEKNLDGATKLSVLPSVAVSLFDSGVYLPAVTRVLFNAGTKVVRSHLENKTYDDVNQKTGEKTTKTVLHKVIDESRPVLATIVEFADGTKSEVISSVHDSAKLLDADGKVTREAKEAGFVYALAKRMLVGRYACAESHDGLTYEAAGFGRELASYIDNAYDCQQAKHDNAAKKAAAVKAHAERKAAADAKPKHQSLAATVDKLAEAVARLEAFAPKSC